MSEALGQPIVVENKTGASGNLAAAQVAKSAADGYTILAHSSAYAVNPSLFNDPGYDAQKDFIPVAVVASQPNLILVNAECPARPVAELLPMARAQKLNDAVLRAVQSPDIRERLDGLAFEPTAAPLRETADYVKSELVKWAKVVRDSGAKAE